jgi:hypothetical protein
MFIFNNKTLFSFFLIYIYSADRPHREQMIRQYLLQEGNTLPSMTTTTTTTTANSIDTIRTVLHKAVHYYSMLQTSDGHWSGDYGGPHFLLPGLIIVWYCMGQPKHMIHPDDIQLMIAYISNHQQIDGGWGTHIESPSTMFGTTLMYVAIRLLGISENDPICSTGRTFIQQQGGGAIMTSSWAKFYLCILGVMHWDGHNSVPPEMWLLPNWFPFHPGRMWCHARMVYRKYTIQKIFSACFLSSFSASIPNISNLMLMKSVSIYQ